MPFSAVWLGKTPEERNRLWKEMCKRTNAEWKRRWATMTDDEIEEKYKVLYFYPDYKTRNKRRKQEKIILENRINK